MNGRLEQPAGPKGTRPKSFDDYQLTLGDVMRGERATKGKSLLEVQRDIKIKAEYLAAIEDADLTKFETPGFIAGYVRAYARYLGMNPDWVYRNFCEESGFSHVAGLEAQIYTKKSARRAAPTGIAQPAKTGKVTDIGDAVLARSPIYSGPTPGLFSGVQPGAVVSLLVLLVLIAGLGYGGWSVLKQIQKVTMTPVDTGLSVAENDTAPEETGLLAANAVPTPAALDRLYRPQALDVPVLVARDGPIATLDPSSQGLYAQYVPPDQTGPVSVASNAAQTPTAVAGVDGALTEAIAPQGAEVQVVDAGVPEVVLFARRPAWVRVKAADGTVLLEKILEQGEHFTLPATDQPPTLRAGNSGSVFFAVNGATFGPAGKGTSVAKNVVLSAEALTQSYTVANLTEDPELARLAALVTDPATVRKPE